MVKNSINHTKSDVQDDTLFWHYTGTDAFRLIVENETLRATDYRYMNDPLEGDVSRQVIKMARDQIVGNSPLTSSSASLMRAIVKAHLGNGANLKKSVKLKFPERGPYLISFSREGDLLSQWRAYVRSGGYAIAFKKSDLERRAFSYAGEFQKVKYLSKKNLPRANSYFYSQPQAQSNPKRMDLVPFLTSLCNHKMNGYQEEAEWRMVIPGPEPQWYRPQATRKHYSGNILPIPALKFRDGMVGLTPYIEVPLAVTEEPPLPIQHVIVSPGPNAELRKLAAEQLLAGANVKVTLSRTELRP